MTFEYAVYIKNIIRCKEKISELPADEAKYYMYILVNSIMDKNNELTNNFLIVLLALLDNLHELHHSDKANVALFNQIMENYNELTKIAQINTKCAQVKSYLLQVGSAIAAFICGIIGGIIGGAIGLARGTLNGIIDLSRGTLNIEPFRGLIIGLITGYFLGALVGFRTPKKLFKDELLRKLQFALNGLDRSLDNLSQSMDTTQIQTKPIAVYIEEERAFIRNKCFTSDSDFEHFLNNDITYEINSFKAGFIGGSSLHGYLGNHFYIVIKIDTVEHLIEFTLAPADTTEIPNQQELRTVSGKTIIEMLACYKKLQETTPCTMAYILNRMKPGDNDCQTLVNKVLIATNQLPTKLARFADMNRVGTMIGYFINKVSPFQQGFFNRQVSECEANDLQAPIPKY